MNFKVELDKELDDLLDLKIHFNTSDHITWNFNKAKNLLEFESSIGKFADVLRFEWKRRCFNHTEKIYKSPSTPQELNTLNGSKVNFKYERAINYRDWEDKYFQDIDNFMGFSMFFSSGMGAMINVFHLVRIMFKGTLRGLLIGDYYETTMLIKNLSIKDMEVNHLNNKSEINNDENYDFIILEPVRYNTFLHAINEDMIVNYINDSKSLKTIIIDYTLLSSSFDKESFMKRLNKNIFIFFVKSTLKLDQSGLEFANSSQVSVYANPNLEEYLVKLRDLFEGQRNVFGSSLSFYEVCQLDYSKFNKDTDYVGAVLNNARNFSKNLIDSTSDIEVIHPSVLSHTNHSPFLFVRPKEGRLFNEFKQYLRSYLSKFNVNIPCRNSFGFRNISMEAVQMNGSYNVLKVAPGKINGVKQQVLLDGIIYSTRHIGSKV
ncbi:hypothetical protein [Virgibacillus sp. CBA3643]|uniref:hypothetical protein n=1 Tax=Virgibacillus sp. CBA3643 TaxID=2942278 RepID=UPI0035A2CA8A